MTFRNILFLFVAICFLGVATKAATPTKAQIQAQLDATTIELTAAKARIAESEVRYRVLLELYEQVTGIQKMRAEVQTMEARCLKAEGDLSRRQVEVMQLTGRNQQLEQQLAARK